MMLLLGAYGYVRVQEERDNRLAEFRRRNAVTSKAIQLAVEHALRDPSIADVRRLVSELVVKQTEIVRIRLVDATLRPLLDSNLLSGDEGVPLERLRLVVETGQPDSVDRRWTTFRLYSDLVPLRPRGATVDGVLEVVYVAARLEQDLLNVNYTMTLHGGILFVTLTLLIGFVLQREVLHPLAQLMEGIQRFGRGEPAAPVPVQRRDELGRLADAFNQMTARLETARFHLEAETERSFELSRHLRRTETLALAGKLCSSMAHEVGTPLNIIAGRTELMLQTLPPGDALREDLEAILAQIDRISKIIRTVLDPIRPRKPDVQPISLGTVLEVLLPLLRHTARTRRVTFTVVVPPNLPQIRGDSGHLQQMLLNLLMNALEATPAGGRVELKAEPQRHRDRPGVAIAITDTGPGIAAESLPRIFDPFFSTKPAGEGTGLGLAICKDIAQEHEGEILVESKEGVGTTFTVFLPEAERDQR